MRAVAISSKMTHKQIDAVIDGARERLHEALRKDRRFSMFVDKDVKVDVTRFTDSDAYTEGDRYVLHVEIDK